MRFVMTRYLMIACVVAGCGTAAPHATEPPEVVCTLVGCSDHFTIDVQPGIEVNARTRVFGSVDGAEFNCTAVLHDHASSWCPEMRRMHCEGSGVEADEQTNDESCTSRLLSVVIRATPKLVDVTVEHEATVTHRVFRPDYRIVAPNGPTCGPTCRQADARLL